MTRHRHRDARRQREGAQGEQGLAEVDQTRRDQFGQHREQQRARHQHTEAEQHPAGLLPFPRSGSAAVSVRLSAEPHDEGAEPHHVPGRAGPRVRRERRVRREVVQQLLQHVERHEWPASAWFEPAGREQEERHDQQRVPGEGQEVRRDARRGWHEGRGAHRDQHPGEHQRHQLAWRAPRDQHPDEEVRRRRHGAAQQREQPERPADVRAERLGERHDQQRERRPGQRGPGETREQQGRARQPQDTRTRRRGDGEGDERIVGRGGLHRNSFHYDGWGARP